MQVYKNGIIRINVWYENFHAYTYIFRLFTGIEPTFVIFANFSAFIFFFNFSRFSLVPFLARKSTSLVWIHCNGWYNTVGRIVSLDSIDRKFNISNRIQSRIVLVLI